jgi:hypothetical protein
MKEKEQQTGDKPEIHGESKQQKTMRFTNDCVLALAALVKRGGGMETESELMERAFWAQLSSLITDIDRKRAMLEERAEMIEKINKETTFKKK